MTSYPEGRPFASTRAHFVGAAAVLGVLAFVGHVPSAQAAALSAFGSCSAKLPPQFATAAECATLTVLEDPTKRNGRHLELPLMRLRSTSSTPGTPVFVLNGGPGNPNVNVVGPVAPVLADRDLYYLGYRGADGSDVFTCPEIDRLITAANPLSRENLGKLTGASKACAGRLRKTGYDLSHYTMVDVVADLEAARTALGLRKVALLSASYGTRVAQIYARRHPDSIERSVMIVPNTPGHFVYSAYANDTVLRRLAELCHADPACVAKSPDLRRTILNAISLRERGVSTAIDDDKVRLALFASLQMRRTVLAFVAAAQAAEAGDIRPLAALSENATMLKGVIWGDLLSKGSSDRQRYAEVKPTFAATSESMGSPEDILNEALAKGWPEIPFPEEYRRAGYDNTETLVVSGDMDVSTPLIFLEAELMPWLTRGQLVVLKDCGHFDFVLLPALGQAIADFLKTGQVNRTSLQPPPFKFQ